MDTTHTPPALSCALLALLVLTGCPCAPREPDPSTEADAGPDGGASRDALTEREPNDQPGQATEFVAEARSPGSPLLKPLRGEFSSASDVDWIALPAADGARLRSLEARAEDADIELLWGAADKVQNLAGEDEAEHVPNLTTGAVVIGLRARQGAAFPRPWQLTLQHLPARSTADAEDGADTAQDARAPGDLQGLINHAGDVDRFRLDTSGLGERRVLTVEARSGDEGGVEVTIGPADAPWATLRATSAAPATLPNLGIPPGGGPIEVAVRGVDPGRAQARAWTVRLVPHATLPEGLTLEVEPNAPDTPIALATPGRVRGYLHTADDRDAFAFTLPPLPDAQTVHVLSAWLSAEDDDLVLAWTLPVTSGEPERGQSNAWPAGKRELLCNRVLPPGPLTFEVARAPSDDPPTSPTTGRYNLELQLRAEKAVEAEPNNTAADATRIAPGDPLRGWLATADDIDLFRLDVRSAEKKVAPNPEKNTEKQEGDEEGGGLSRVLDRLTGPKGDDKVAPAGDEPVHVEVEVNSRGLRLSAELQDSDGVALVSRTQQIAGDLLKLTADVPPGVYLLRLTDAGNERADCDGGYTVSVAP